MAEKKIHLRIVTPVKLLYDKEVDMVILRGTEGDMGILNGHEPRATILGYGPLRIVTGSVEEEVAVLGGYAEIVDNKVTVLSDAAEWPDEIDKMRAEAAKLRAEQRILQKEAGVDLQRAELAMRRSLVRIEVSTYPLLKGNNNAHKG